MPGPSFKLNRRGVREILNSSEMSELMTSAAEQAGEAASAELEGEGIEVEVTAYSTDRAAASIAVPVWAQAHRGALTRAAASLGLEVRPR
ncbi:hypothetical protein [Nocardia nova]|nr:hypothetical protein [Nocardia nova]